MRLFLVLAAALTITAAAYGDQQIVATGTPDGGVKLEAVTAQEIVVLGPDEKGRRKVTVFLDGKKYEGTIQAVNGADPKAKTPR